MRIEREPRKGNHNVRLIEKAGCGGLGRVDPSTNSPQIIYPEDKEVSPLLAFRMESFISIDPNRS